MGRTTLKVAAAGVALACCLLWATAGAPQAHHHPGSLLAPAPVLPLRLRLRGWLARAWAAAGLRSSGGGGGRWARRAPGGQQQQQRAVKGPPFHNQGLAEVAYSDPASGVFLGSPSIARLDADTLLISHDYFPEWGRPKRTSIYASKDGGASWDLRATVSASFWSSLFVHRGAAYLVGVDDGEGANALSVQRSWDGGATWNRSAVLPAPPGCQWATGSVDMLLQAGTIYRGVELVCGTPVRWPQSFRALLAYAPAAADLLDPASWRTSEAAPFDSASMLPAWMPGPVESGGYLEGNAVPLPGGAGVGLLLRCRFYDAAARSYTMQHACFFHLVPAPAAGASSTAGGSSSSSSEPRARTALELAGASAQQPAVASAASGSGSSSGSSGNLGFGGGSEAAPPAQLAWQGLVSMPGGGNKFSVEWDPSTGLYLALTNPSIDRYGANYDARNILTLVYSRNLRDWRVATTVLLPNDGLPWDDSLWLTGYQYPDLLLDGADALAAVRTSWGGAHSFHDANRITFKRVPRYRQYLPAAVPSGGGGGGSGGSGGGA